MTHRGRPFTDRLLGRLPGPRASWVIAWTLLVAVRPFIYYGLTALLAGSAQPLERIPRALPGTLVLAYMTALALWGVKKLGEDAAAIVPSIESVLPDGHPSPDPIPRAIYGGAGPLALSAALALFYTVNYVKLMSLGTALLTVPLTFVVHIPVMTEFWVLLMILVGFYRLGRMELVLDRHFANPSLGLALVGILGFSGFWIFFATVAPFLLVSARHPMDLIVGGVFAIAPVVLLFTSLYRLHVQMVAARVRYVTWARALYEDVLAPLRHAGSPADALAEKPVLVSAAEAIVTRAEATQEWPFTDRMLGIMLGVLGSVLASLAGRLLLEGFGL